MLDLAAASGAPRARVDRRLRAQDLLARKRLVGGFYAYENVIERSALGTLCEGRTDRRGRFACEATAPAPRPARAAGAHARRRGARGRDQRRGSGSPATTTTGPPPRAATAWTCSPTSRATSPATSRFLQVRMPFREATALVDGRARRRGRGVRDEALGARTRGSRCRSTAPTRRTSSSPCWRCAAASRSRSPPRSSISRARRYGSASIQMRVGWRAHELRVAVKPEHESYRVRETAKLRVAVRTPDGDVAAARHRDRGGRGRRGPARADAERELEAARRDDGPRAPTACAPRPRSSRWSGKRHYGRKALPAGGGGGRPPDARALRHAAALAAARAARRAAAKRGSRSR